MCKVGIKCCGKQAGVFAGDIQRVLQQSCTCANRFLAYLPQKQSRVSEQTLAVRFPNESRTQPTSAAYCSLASCTKWLKEDKQKVRGCSVAVRSIVKGSFRAQVRIYMRFFFHKSNTLSFQWCHVKRSRRVPAPQPQLFKLNYGENQPFQIESGPDSASPPTGRPFHLNSIKKFSIWREKTKERKTERNKESGECAK